MQSTVADIISYGIFWAVFGCIHSFMASETFKEPWRRILGPLAGFERLIFNAVSVVALHAVLSFGRYNLAFAPVFQPTDIFRWALYHVQGAGILLLIWGLSAYDLGLFAGLKQVWAGFRKRRVDFEPMARSLPHQYIRHPLYSGLLLVIWFRPLNEFMFFTNLFATIYLLLGMRLEEGRLSILYGAEYDSYRRAIPALFPNPKRRWHPPADAETDS